MTGSVLGLKRAYGAMCPPSSLPRPLIHNSDSAQFQEILVNDILHLPHFREFPPSREFRRLFWKWIVESLEDRNEEVDERIYEAYLNIISVPTPSLMPRPPSPSYNTHFWSPSSRSLQGTEKSRVTTLLESRTVIEGGTTGLRTWGASLRLADWLISHSGTLQASAAPDLLCSPEIAEVVQHRRVLELGSGAGFLGLIIAALQLDKYETHHVDTPSLLLTDANSEVLSRCRDNFQLPCNRLGAHPSVDFRILDWSDALDGEGDIDHLSVITEVLKNTDAVIGADLVYDATIIPALVAVLALFFSIKRGQEPASQHGNLSAYIALTIRREDTVSKFLDCLSSHHLDYEEFQLNAGPETQFMGRSEVGIEENVKLVRIYATNASS